jgi:hypothetical protein
MEEARRWGRSSSADDAGGAPRFRTLFAGRFTEGFDVERDLERVAVVNQTTLLMNETREIIAYLRDVYAQRFGPDARANPARVGGQGRNDTLCYATQVNQDALARALAEPLDAAFVVGGKNSSNTYQLYRLCEQRLGHRAFFIQSEANILSTGRPSTTCSRPRAGRATAATSSAGPSGTTPGTPRRRSQAHPRHRGRLLPGRDHPAGDHPDQQLLPAGVAAGVESVLADLAES